MPDVYKLFQVYFLLPIKSACIKESTTSLIQILVSASSCSHAPINMQTWYTYDQKLQNNPRYPIGNVTFTPVFSFVLKTSLALSYMAKFSS